MALDAVKEPGTAETEPPPAMALEAVKEPGMAETEPRSPW